MYRYLHFSRKLLLIFTPLLASTVLAASPSRAATGFSSAEVLFTSFSQSPTDIFTDTNTNTLAISKGGTVTADANAFAVFEKNPSVGFNFSTSIVSGNKRNYFGIAESESAIKGIFEISENSLFSFDFLTNLTLTTSVDDTQVEKANASSDIYFALIDLSNNNVLDYFSFGGVLTAGSDQDFVQYNNSENITLTNTAIQNSYGSNEEFINGFIQGSVKYYFANKTNLALVEFKKSSVILKVPESSSSLSLVCVSIVGIILKLKH